MTDTSQLTPIPNFSAYAIELNGTVWRTTPAKRGISCGKSHRVSPVIHPKGFLWAVQLTDDTGKRKRIAVNKLLEIVFGTQMQS